jgi:hypothetical protein
MSEVVPAPTGSRTATRQIWSERFDRFAQTRLSVAAFCEAEGVSTQSYYYWKRKLASGPADAEGDLPRLLPVHLLGSACPVELVLPSGPILRLAPGCDLAFVRSLVAALGDSSC